MDRTEYKKALFKSLKQESEEIDYFKIISESGIFDKECKGLIGSYNKIIIVNDVLLLKYKLAKTLLEHDYYESTAEKEFIDSFKTFSEIGKSAGMRKDKITKLGCKAHLSFWNKFKITPLELSLSNIIISNITSEIPVNTIVNWIKSIMKSSGKAFSISERTLWNYVKDKLS